MKYRADIKHISSYTKIIHLTTNETTVLESARAWCISTRLNGDSAILKLYVVMSNWYRQQTRYHTYQAPNHTTLNCGVNIAIQKRDTFQLI